uniref:Uncharacterized protein n=1 Tax=viral metagenome TaxID=1070528 RepID=A0A6C0L0D1_9ZZZZ
MVSCSKRRKTIPPFCKDDSRCYWNNKSCKRRPGVHNNTRRNMNNMRVQDHHAQNNAKLNLILHKLNNIEMAIHKLTRKTNVKSAAPKSARTAKASNVEKMLKDYEYNENTSMGANNSPKTASPTNVALLMNQNNNLSKTNSRKTASPNAVNRLKRLMNQN